MHRAWSLFAGVVDGVHAGAQDLFGAGLPEDVAGCLLVSHRDMSGEIKQ